MALILVADDDADIRELVRLRLTAWGHEVVCAANGDEALTALRENPVDLAILDIMMPGRGGLDVLIEERAHEKREGAPRLPVAMMSAKSQASDIAEAYRLGADDYLVKPFTATSLTSVLSTMTTRQPATTGRATA